MIDNHEPATGQVQSDEEALAEAIHNFVNEELFLKTESFLDKLTDYITDIRANAYKEGYAQGKSDEAQARDQKDWDNQYKRHK